MAKCKRFGQFSVLSIWSIRCRENGKKERFSAYCADTLRARDRHHAKKLVKKAMKAQFRKIEKQQPSAVVIGKHYSIFELSAEILRKQAKTARPRAQIRT